MDKTDNLNFRGKYKQYDADGNRYLYKIGDVVEYNSVKYVSISPTTSRIPGTQEGSVVWKEMGSDNAFYIKEPPAPSNANTGDRWFVPSTAILYTYVQEETNEFWVEL